MGRVLAKGVEIGSVEQVQGGRWFAEGITDHVTWRAHIGLGAFATWHEARQAVMDHHAGREIKGALRPKLIVGPPPQGMA